jgi:hypothetical protein
MILLFTGRYALLLSFLISNNCLIYHACCLSACGNAICRTCLIQCNNKCPHCQSSNIPLLAQLSCPRPLVKMLDALMVHCPNCRISLPRERLASHDQHQCLQPCPNNNNDGCVARIPRSLMSSHLSDECGYTSVTCTSVKLMCPWNGRRMDRNSHLLTCHYHALSPLLTTLLTGLESAVTRLSSAEATIIEMKAKNSEIPRLQTDLKDACGTILINYQLHMIHYHKPMHHCQRRLQSCEMNLRVSNQPLAFLFLSSAHRLTQ